MLSKEEFLEKLKLISDPATDSERQYELLTEVESDFDDRTRVVDEYAQKTFYEDSEVFDNDGVRWSEKYDDMKRRFRDRFFSSIDEPIADQEADIAEDEKAEKKTFDDLFITREGDYEGGK